jgi:hypothetical protein
MCIRIYVNHYCLNMTLYRWLPCHSLHSCSHDGELVITHCTMNTVPHLLSKLLVLVERVPYAQLVAAPKEIVWALTIKWAGAVSDVCELWHGSAQKKCSEDSSGNTCHVSSCSQHHCVWWWSIWQCHLAGKLSGNCGALGSPPHLMSHYQTTSFGALSEASWNMLCQ